VGSSFGNVQVRAEAVDEVVQRIEARLARDRFVSVSERIRLTPAGDRAAGVTVERPIAARDRSA
jgi:hypothetical protein